jgi:hypothetical protein
VLAIQKCSVPPGTLLHGYTVNGAYTDCYSTDLAGQASFANFVFAFYMTPLFKLERWILKAMVSKPSSDSEARQLADGHIRRFAAWHVEDRRDRELLMCDFVERTRSWFMVAPVSTIATPRTRLYFGSAVVPVRNSKTGQLSLGLGYRSLLGFHRIYSVLLLYSAAARLQRSHAVEGI